MTSLDLSLWLAVVAGTLGIDDEPDDETGLTLVDAWLMNEDDVAPVYCRGADLLAATGLRSHRQLRRPFDRLAASVVRVSLKDGPDVRLWKGWEASPIDRNTPVERGIVSALALNFGLLVKDPWPIEVDLRGMAAFGSRHSAILYLRSLAWLAGAGTPKDWGRTPPGERVSLTIPIAALHRALGTNALRGMGQWNERAFGPGGRGGPVHRDLASVGLRLETTWVMAGTGARRVPVALGITVARAPVGARRVRRQDVRKSRSSASSAP
ncbi:hypothetical protein [Methylobacterium sp. WL120]|uniref:hypothetical protein n=1 Tax=Methylobacterium sp. WL120 TaxID=2603887 RepID=UPI0011CA41F9|nr:hypothetical protein [Methylobacterium sp. WL120]TXM68554.1 hypothetical protein FV229_07370 [Methylobacterium sp. WL120]